MAQPVYPTLSSNPDEGSFVREPLADPTIRTPIIDGAYLVMAKTTAVPDTWSFAYRNLSTTDRDTLLDFWADDANFGAVVVKWTDPTDLTDYFVHFADKPKVTRETGVQQNLWRVEVSLVQALGSYT